MTAEIVLPLLILTTASIVAAIITYLHMSEAKQKAEEAMEWWAGLFFSLAGEIVKELQLVVRTTPEGKVTLIKDVAIKTEVEKPTVGGRGLWESKN